MIFKCDSYKSFQKILPLEILHQKYLKVDKNSPIKQTALAMKMYLHSMRISKRKIRVIKLTLI